MQAEKKNQIVKETLTDLPSWLNRKPKISRNQNADAAKHFNQKAVHTSEKSRCQFIHQIHGKISRKPTDTQIDLTLSSAMIFPTMDEEKKNLSF